MLLDKGTNVNIGGGKYGTALQAAAYAADVEIVMLLLLAGADVSAEGGKYRTALRAARADTWCKREVAADEIVKLLQKHGAMETDQAGQWDAQPEKQAVDYTTVMYALKPAGYYTMR